MKTKNTALELIGYSEAIHIDGVPVTYWEIFRSHNLQDGDADLGESAVTLTIDTDGLVSHYDFSMADLKNSVVNGNKIRLIDTDGTTSLIECFKLVPLMADETLGSLINEIHLG